jgi:hypothetical protein
MVFLREGALQHTDLFANQEMALPFPFWFNLPLKPLSAMRKLLDVTDCHQWYMFQFGENTP